MAHLGEDVPPFSAPVETGPKGRGDQERSQARGTEMETGAWSGRGTVGCGEQPGNQGSMCKESCGHGAEAGGIGWGKVANLNSL